MRISRRAIVVAAGVALCLVALAALAARLLLPERSYDPRFDSRVDRPAYAQDGPVVLFDEAHLNIHTADGAYRPFVDLARNDGYRVHVLRDLVTAERLRGVQVFVIAAARGPSETNDDPAFTDGEVEAIVQWVHQGGALLLVTDHWPFGSASDALARRLGVEMGNGLVRDPEHFERPLGDTHLVFSRENGLLEEHPITRGRSPSERVDRILTFTGQSLLGPPQATQILRLGQGALDHPPTTPTVQKRGSDVVVNMTYGDATPAGGRAQALALEAGQGRVVVLGESGLFRAYHNQGKPVGMNYPGYENRQLALNVLHWLSRLI